MERIINLEEIILKEDEVLAEVFQKKSLIITTIKTVDEFDYCKVISTGSLVKDLKKDDILLQMNTGEMFEIGKKVFLIVRRYGINIAVKPDNFLINKISHIN